MATFASHSAAALRAPPRTLTLPPSAFASKWTGRPSGEVTIGLCLWSCEDLESAKQFAAREAWQQYPHADAAELRAQAMDEVLMRWLAARGTCAPDNVDAPVEFWAGAPEDLVKEALSVEGLKLIFDALEQLAIEESPTTPEANEDDVGDLLILWPVLKDMSPLHARRIRRLIGYCAREMRADEHLLLLED